MVQQLWSRDRKAENIFKIFLYIYKNIHIIYYYINIYIFLSFPKKLSPGPFPAAHRRAAPKVMLPKHGASLPRRRARKVQKQH